MAAGDGVGVALRAGPDDGRPADVLVVGAGASGAVAALRLVEAGLHVVVLEQGGWPDRAAFPGASETWELEAGQRWSALPDVRRAPADYPLDLSASDMAVVNWNGVGGGTVLFQAAWPRPRPDDFRTRTVDGVGDDWPFGYDELLPYYERIDRQFGVSGLGGDPMYPPGADPPLPPMPIGEAGLRVARAHARLGWHWWPHPLAINSARYDGRHVCVQRGTCASGCNEGAKASTDLTHWPAFLARGGRLVPGARVRRIVVDDAGLACGAEWLDADGGVHHQAADVVLCAANGIGTPRLLLLSASARHPGGLANSSDLVGRNLMLHPTIRATGLFDDGLGTWQGANGALIISLQFYGSDPARGFVRGAKWTLGPTGGPLGIALLGDRWGAGHHRHVSERLGRSVGWNMMCEDLPDPANRVVLADGLVDSSGLPAPKLRYRVDDNLLRMQAWHAERASESLRAAGAWHVDVVPGRINGHFMGTARMGDDPATSVVDRWGFAHDVPNLGIIDGSVFVTSSGMNPTATIAALALRSAEHLLARRGSLPRPDHAAAPAPGRREHVTSPRPPEPAAGAVPCTDEQRTRLAALADTLIPGDGELPPASVVGVAGALLDRVLDVRPDLRTPLQRALAVAVPAGPGDLAWLPALRADDPLAARALLSVVAGGYYLHPEVRARIGYPGQVPMPVNALASPAWLEEGLLDHLVAPTPPEDPPVSAPTRAPGTPRGRPGP